MPKHAAFGSPYGNAMYIATAFVFRIPEYEPRHSTRLPDNIRPRIESVPKIGTLPAIWYIRLPISEGLSENLPFLSFSAACLGIAELHRYGTYEYDERGKCIFVKFDEDKMGLDEDGET